LENPEVGRVLFEKSSTVETHGLRLAKRACFGLVRVLNLLAALPYGPIAPVRLLHRAQSTLYEYRFGLAAFLIPLGVRAVPEIIVGPYAVGFDTMAFYVPRTPDPSGVMHIFSDNRNRFRKTEENSHVPG